MKRIALMAVFYLMLMNAVAAVMDASGFLDEMGVSVELGVSAKFEAADQAFESIRLSDGLGETLFAIFDTVTATVDLLFETLTAGPSMLIQLGIPSGLVDPFTVVAGIIAGLALIYYASGR